MATQTKQQSNAPIHHPHEHFGGCPRCGANDGFLNIQRTHWFYCTAHRSRWWGGSNLFRCWRFETPSDWADNQVTLSTYQVVEPVYRLDDVAGHAAKKKP